MIVKRLGLIIVSFFVVSAAICQETPVVPLDSLSKQTFAKVEVESEFPGGREAWAKFLMNNLEYPQKAVRKRIQGTVVLQFIVNKEGDIEDAAAISGPPILQEAALKLIRKSPKWIPAQQSGKKVKSYKKQPIVFSLGR